MAVHSLKFAMSVCESHIYQDVWASELQDRLLLKRETVSAESYVYLKGPIEHYSYSLFARQINLHDNTLLLLTEKMTVMTLTLNCILYCHHNGHNE